MFNYNALRSRFRSSLALWGLVLTMVLSGWKVGTWVVITSFGLLGQWEFYMAQKEKGLPVYQKSGVFCGFLLYLNTLVTLVYRPDLGHFYWVGEGIIFVICLLGALMRLVISGEPRKTPVVSIALTMLGFIYIAYLFNYVARVAFWPSPAHYARFIVLYLLAVTKFTDLGAYVVGSAIGRNKMAPVISPGKTWEGCLGGMAFALGISLLLVYLLPGDLGPIGWRDAVLLGLMLPLAATIGDLAESVIKRDAAIKDSGHTIPGIGGVLDLIDSILFTAPVMYFYLYLIQAFRHA
jgi:phosphatidate cytidylyltransferase